MTSFTVDVSNKTSQVIKTHHSKMKIINDLLIVFHSRHFDKSAQVWLITSLIASFDFRAEVLLVQCGLFLSRQCKISRQKKSLYFQGLWPLKLLTFWNHRLLMLVFLCNVQTSKHYTLQLHLCITIKHL